MKILLTPLAHAKIIAMFQAVTSEVGALMSGRIVEGGDVLVEDIFITSQVVSGADVDFTEEGVDQGTMLAIQQGKVIVGWVHSHGSMKEFWSGTDERAITKLIEHTGSWIVSIVGNHACNMRGRVDYYSNSPFGNQRIKADELQISVVSEVTDEIRDEIKALIDANVTTRVQTAFYGTGYQGDWSAGRRWGKNIGKAAKDPEKTAIPKTTGVKSPASGSTGGASPVQMDEKTRQNLILFYMSQGKSEEEAIREVDEV